MSEITLRESRAVMERIEYASNVDFFVYEANFQLYLYACHHRKDANTRKLEFGYTRAYEILPRTLTGVVTTAFMAVEDLAIHELREGFKYDGRRVFDPHIDLEK